MLPTVVDIGPSVAIDSVVGNLVTSAEEVPDTRSTGAIGVKSPDPSDSVVASEVDGIVTPDADVVVDTSINSSSVITSTGLDGVRVDDWVVLTISTGDTVVNSPEPSSAGEVDLTVSVVATSINPSSVVTDWPVVGLDVDSVLATMSGTVCVVDVTIGTSVVGLSVRITFPGSLGVPGTKGVNAPEPSSIAGDVDSVSIVRVVSTISEGADVVTSPGPSGSVDCDIDGVAVVWNDFVVDTSINPSSVVAMPSVGDMVVTEAVESVDVMKDSVTVVVLTISAGAIVVTSPEPSANVV